MISLLRRLRNALVGNGSLADGLVSNRYQGRVGEAPAAPAIGRPEHVINNSGILLGRRLEVDHIFETLERSCGSGASGRILVLTTACHRDWPSLLFERVSQFEVPRRHKCRAPMFPGQEINWVHDDGSGVLRSLQKALERCGLAGPGRAEGSPVVVAQCNTLPFRHWPSGTDRERLRKNLQSFITRYEDLALAAGTALITFVEFEGAVLDGSNEKRRRCEIIDLLDKLEGDCKLVLERPERIYPDDINPWATTVIELLGAGSGLPRDYPSLQILRMKLASYYKSDLAIGLYYRDLDEDLGDHARSKYNEWVAEA